MQVLLDIDGNTVTLSQLCQLIYQGYGQETVIKFLDSIGHDQWLVCEGCDNEESPMWEGTCLVCGGRP